MIKAYQNEKILLIKPGSPEAWMEPGDEEEIEMKARVNRRTMIIKDFKGEQVASAIDILITPEEEIYYEYHFKIEDVTYSILKIDRKQDFSARYLQIWLG